MNLYPINEDTYIYIGPRLLVQCTQMRLPVCVDEIIELCVDIVDIVEKWTKDQLRENDEGTITLNM